MKKVIPLVLSLFLSLMFSVSAEDARFVFALSESAVGTDETAYVVVSVSEHEGFTGLALNVVYDCDKLRYVSYECSDCLPEGMFSVYDNEYGNVRVTFVPFGGMTYFYGDIVTLGFESLGGECSSVIRIEDSIAVVTDRNYKAADYVSVDGKAEFTDK